MVVITVCGGGCACVVVVVAAVHGGDGHPCVSVVVLLYDYIHAWWMWSIMNEDVN